MRGFLMRKFIQRFTRGLVLGIYGLAACITLGGLITARESHATGALGLRLFIERGCKPRLP